MAINIKFDLAGNPEPPTILLAARSGKILGQLNVNTESIDLSDKFSDASEISFTLNKYVNDEITNLWDKIVNFKLIYCKEWNMWFEINVELDEETETVKTVFCKQLGQAELSQIMLYNIEINTEEDIARDDYKITILYDENDSEASLLDRILKDKASHYRIAHVDPTIAKLQRSFSFDGTSILDAHQEIAEEIGCLFDYPSNSDENGKIQRDIYVYDLQQNCNDCGYRGEFTDVCPKCGSTNIKHGYGEDTLIFVTADELASDGIQLTTDTDSVKNCFKLEAGDDLMTATIRNCNPNGTDYIWHLSDAVKEDMSEELVEKLNSYDEVYRQYNSQYVSNIDAELLNNYNSLIDKYFIYNKELQSITTPIIGYSSLMNAYYNAIDLELYLRSGLMPSVEMSKTSAEEQVKLLTTSSLSPIGVGNASIASLATANSAVLAMAKIVVKSTYKVQIGTSELYTNGNKKYWKGNFIVTNYSDEEDTATSDVIDLIEIVDNDETIIKQKIEKALNKENTDDLSISGLFKKEYDDFCNELKKYALNPLTSFHAACQVCIDILIEQGVGSNDTWGSDVEGSESNLYEKLYTPYYNKLMAIESEIKVREDEINIISGVYDSDGNLIVKGLQTNIEECKIQIQNSLDFENYLGEDLWLEFCTYRREDKYSNDNYISDGLNNAELFKVALEFIEVAENEIYKSAELQHSIATSLKNLLAIEKFKPLVKYFKLGNWIRVQVDNKIYKLRLLSYDISYGDFGNIPVEFSDVTKIRNGITDVKDVLSQASSMATSYDSVKKQANQGNDAKVVIEDWYKTGLNSALINIKNNNNEEITFDNNGILARSYDDILDDYNPKQMRITHNIMALTDDNWETVSLGIGEHDYQYYDSNKILNQGTGYGVSAKFLSAGYINGSQIIGGEIYSQNYSTASETETGTGTYMNLNDGTFSWAGGKIRYNGSDLILSGVNMSWVDIKDAPSIPSDEYITQISQNSITSEVIAGWNLEVGNQVKMGENATISWNNVDGKPNDLAYTSDIPSDEYITTITNNTIATTNVIAKNLKVESANIEGTIQGKTVVVGGENNGDGSIVVKDNNGDIICTIDKNGIKIQSRAMTYTDGKTILDGLTTSSGITYSGFIAGNNVYAGNSLYSDCSGGIDEGAVTKSVFVAGIDMTGYSKMTIISTSLVGANYGLAYVNYGIDSVSSSADSANQMFHSKNYVGCTPQTFTIEIDISGYTGLHKLFFYQYARNDSSSPSYGAFAGVGLTSIILGN